MIYIYIELCLEISEKSREIPEEFQPVFGIALDLARAKVFLSSAFLETRIFAPPIMMKFISSFFFFNDFGGLSQFRNPAAWPVWLFTRDKRGMRYYVDVACVE